MGTGTGMRRGGEAGVKGTGACAERGGRAVSRAVSVAGPSSSSWYSVSVGGFFSTDRARKYGYGVVRLALLCYVSLCMGGGVAGGGVGATGETRAGAVEGGDGMAETGAGDESGIKNELMGELMGKT